MSLYKALDGSNIHFRQMQKNLESHHLVISSESLVQAGGPSIAPGFTGEMLCVRIQFLCASQINRFDYGISLLIITFTGKKSQSQSSLEYLHHCFDRNCIFHEKLRKKAGFTITYSGRRVKLQGFITQLHQQNSVFGHIDWVFWKTFITILLKF